MIAIDGWQIPGYDTQVNAGVKLAGGDMSGFGSFALSSDNGVKPGVLTIKTKIAHADETDLAALITKAKALDENGARVTYTVNNALAEAYKIRKAKFDGEVKATEINDVKGWQVTFKLLEVRSISEREQQQLDTTANQNSQTQSTESHTQIQQQFENIEGP